MGYAVLHMEKAGGSDSGMSAHIERTIAPKNADANRTHLNREIITFPDGVTNRTEAIQHRLETAGLQRKIGNNQVRAVRILLTGSPDDMIRIEQAGKLDEWCKDNLDWLKKTYGADNIVSAVLHLDETTPHIHATMIPIVTGERRKARAEQVAGKKKYRKKSTDIFRLCADDVMSRVRLKEYQNSYAEQMAKYGLQRGVDGSEAKHVTTSQYYRDLLTQSENVQANITQLLDQKQQAEQELSSVKTDIKKEKLKNSVADVGVTLLDSVGSLLGSGKAKTEKERMKQRISELENQAEEREQYIKQIEKDHKTERFKFSEYLDKVKLYFPYVEKLLPLIDYCRNTMHFSDAIISELCKFKKVSLKGSFYSSEFNRKLQAENATFSFEEDKNKKGNFQICVNGSSLVQWFRIKMNEWRGSLSIPTKQNKGMKL